MRREPTRNQHRFYRITITQTLFGFWTMVREWGRIGHPGAVRKMEFAAEGEACEAGERWGKWKEQRGYRIIERRQENPNQRGQNTVAALVGSGASGPTQLGDEVVACAKKEGKGEK